MAGAGKECGVETYRRRKILLDFLAREGSVTVGHAAKLLSVSEVTIRGDLAALAQQSAITRVRGGAVLAESIWAAPTALDSIRHNGSRLAQRATALIEDGESIAISAGPESTALARALTARRQLKIVTNSLEVAGLLAREPTNTVVMVGGVVQPSGAIAIDARTGPALSSLKVGRVFVCTEHLSSSLGLLDVSPERAETLRILLDLAESRIVLLSGHGGAGQALVRVCSLDRVDHVIADQSLPPDFVDGLRARGVTVSLCGTAVVTVPPRNRDQTAFRIGFANLSETEVFTAEVRRGIEEAAAAAGIVELVLADNKYDGETALRNAEQFIAQQVDLVIEYQTDDSYAYRLMHRLRLARIPTIAIDIPLPGATYFGVDNYRAGRIGGEAIAQAVLHLWAGRLDCVLALSLPRSGPSVAARMQGQIDAILESVAISHDHILTIDSENIYETAYRRTLEALRGLAPEAYLAVVAINDAVARGAVAALLETGRVPRAVVVSQGADRLMLKEMSRPGSPVIGAVTFAPERYGERIIPLALDILAGKEAPPAVYQHHVLVRPRDVVDYLAAGPGKEVIAGGQPNGQP
jgi:ribose transport system substrate-binding protein